MQEISIDLKQLTEEQILTGIINKRDQELMIATHQIMELKQENEKLKAENEKLKNPVKNDNTPV